MFRGLISKHSQSAIVAASAISGFTLVSCYHYIVIVIVIVIVSIDCLNVKKITIVD
jgi:hypothetical protein